MVIVITTDVLLHKCKVLATDVLTLQDTYIPSATDGLTLQDTYTITIYLWSVLSTSLMELCF